MCFRNILVLLCFSSDKSFSSEIFFLNTSLFSISSSLITRFSRSLWISFTRCNGVNLFPRNVSILFAILPCSILLRVHRKSFISFVYLSWELQTFHIALDLFSYQMLVLLSCVPEFALKISFRFYQRRIVSVFAVYNSVAVVINVMTHYEGYFICFSCFSIAGVP